ncbi:hypothetical protein OTU49_011812, partial [Cherax quadricarinatus]
MNKLLELLLVLGFAVLVLGRIFRMTVYMRLMLLVCQQMAYLFVMWSLREYYGTCPSLILITLMPHIEVTLRFFFLCSMGDRLRIAHEDVVKAVRDATYMSSSAFPQQHSLSAMSTRIEARPARVEVWGMD